MQYICRFLTEGQKNKVLIFLSYAFCTKRHTSKPPNRVLSISGVQWRKCEVCRSSGCLDIQRNASLRALIGYKNQYLYSFWGKNMENSYSNHHRNLIQMKVDRIKISKRCYTHFWKFLKTGYFFPWYHLNMPWAYARTKDKFNGSIFGEGLIYGGA